MKKLLYTALSLLLATAVFVNCQKDGVFNPKQKISKIHRAHSGGKRLIEEWTWEGNQLSRISYFKNDTTVRDKVYYFYEKKQLVKMENTLDFSYIVITYNGSLYDKIDYYTCFDRKAQTFTFTHDKKKVSKIVHTTYANPQKSMESIADNVLLASFIPQIVLEEMDKKIQKSTSQKANEDVIVTHTLTYDKDNLKEWKISYNVGDKLIESVFAFESYDESKNPYYYSNPLGTDDDNFFIALYKNNPVKIIENRYINNVVGNEPITYDYFYRCNDKKFPTEIIKKSTYMTYSNSDTLYYEYK